MRLMLKPNFQTSYYFLSILKANDERRFALEWLKSVRQKNYLINKPSPWITFGAIEFLENYLQKKLSPRIFEYGSGGSTFYWLKFDADCVSIEHDPKWYKLVKERVGANQMLDYRLILPAPLPIREGNNDYANPNCYLSDDPGFKKYYFKQYVSQIDEFPDKYFDIVLVDGRARPSCVMHAAPKVRVGGLLVLDNADREYYSSQTWPYLKDFEARQFCGIVPGVNARSRTDIFIRRIGKI